MQNTPLGYIGLGTMGRPSAINLLRAGYPVAVWARREESLRPVTAEGGLSCGSPRDVASRSQVIFTNVSDTADVEQVVLGEDGIIAGAAPGSVVVDMSTISPAATRAMARRLGEKGIHMLDAPVSGGEQGAITGALSIMVGGDEAVFQRVLPVLEVMGGNIVHIGPNGAGQVAKSCNQAVVAQTMAAVGEALLLAKASGVDPARVRQALLGGFAGSKILEVHGQRMLEGNYVPGFKAALHKKDMRIVMEAAGQLGLALPGAALAAQFLNALVGQGDGELDSAAISTVQQRLNGVTLAGDQSS
jgi:2-hydroxy-3-oxopropionate reductase